MSFQIEIDKEIKEKNLYFVGDALPPDWYAAFKIWHALAQTGDSKAQFNIGRCYGRGDGCDKDADKAEEWYLKSAKQEDPRAHFDLHLYYSTGAKKDLQKSEDYLQKAVALNESRALKIMSDQAERIRKQEEVERNKILAQEREKRDKEALDKARLVINEIQLLIEAKKIEKAKQRAIEAIGVGHKHKFEEFWAKDIKMALEFEFEMQLVTEITTKTTAGGLIDGTTQYHTFSDQVCYKKIYIKGINWGRDSLWCPRVRVDNFVSYGDPKEGVLEFMGKKTPEESAFLPTTYKVELWGMKETVITIPFPKNFPIKKVTLVNGKEKENKGCFVLTACYNDEDHPVVVDFRNFRDNVLLKSLMGEKLIRFYYEHGPKAADYIKNKPATKAALRGIFVVFAKILPGKGPR